MASTTELLPLMELPSVKLVMKMHIHITSLFVFAYYTDRQTDGQTDKLMKTERQTKRREEIRKAKYQIEKLLSGNLYC